VKAKTSRQRDVFRAGIILGLAQELFHEEIAKEQSVSLLAIGRWRKRWAAEGLKEAPGRGRKARLSAKVICDNYSTHKHAKVTAWLRLIPVSASISLPPLPPAAPKPTLSMTMAADSDPKQAWITCLSSL
jgi:hypothetical protein